MSMSDDKKRLVRYVESFAEQLKTPFEEWDPNVYIALDGDEYNAYDYLDDVLDVVNFLRGSQSYPEYAGAELLVAFGGPNIWIDTRYGTVRGAWWGDFHEVRLHSDADENITALNDALEELYMSL